MNPFPTITWETTLQAFDSTTLQEAVKKAHESDEATIIELTGDVTVIRPLDVPEGTTIYLTSADGGQYTLGTERSGYRVINIATDADQSKDTTVYFGGIIVRDGIGTRDGGAIQSTGPWNAIIVLEDGAVFEGNTAENGGAIALAKGAVGVFGGSLINNRAAQNGGAVYIAEGYEGEHEAFYMDTDNSRIFENEADDSGGGVYIGANGGAVITGGIIEENQAGKGGGIYLEGPGTIGGTAIIGRNAALAGGGVYLGASKGTALDISGDARIIDNSASGPSGGGGVYLTRGQLPFLTAGPLAYFSGNSAIQGFADRLPIDDPVYFANIRATQWSGDFTQGYNNFDISYDGEAGCLVDGQQMVDICLPVSVAPFAKVGTITSRCCGDPIISRGIEICDGQPGGNCNFTIKQKICVNVPVEFGAIAEAGEAHILCPEEDCRGCTPPIPVGGEI